MPFERHHSALVVASLVTVASFVGATAYTQNRLARLDALSSTIENNAVPSIEYLSRAAVRLTRLNQLLDVATDAEGQRATALAAARKELIALEDDVARYLKLPPLDGEQAFWAALRSDVSHAAELVHQAIDEPSSGSTGPQRPDPNAVDDAIDVAIRSVLATLEFDVRQSERMARDVRDLRSSTLRMIIELDAAATLIAVIAVAIAYRASRRHDQLLHEHSALLADRVAELDQFAGRVAHDVLSPLGTIATGLALLGRSSDERGRTYIEASQRAVQRVQQLVEGLLTFARSGARPDADARCDVGKVVANVAADCADAAATNGVELIVEAADAGQVPCTVGVITSIVQNLVRNAINYITSSTVRRVAVRARRVGSHVQIEVEDTGPGIPDELQPTIFDPFVRGHQTVSNGTGLGLATVKRLVESHGGTLGVRSRPGHGSLFWIELPAARVDRAHDASLIN